MHAVWQAESHAVYTVDSDNPLPCLNLSNPRISGFFNINLLTVDSDNHVPSVSVHVSFFFKKNVLKKWSKIKYMQQETLNTLT